MRTTCRNGPDFQLVPQPGLINIPFRLLVITGTSLPFFGVIICTFLSVFSSFDEVTESVCGVSNFVPSISAVTGITPQIYLWRYAIGLHSAPRLLLAATYYQYHKFLLRRCDHPCCGTLVELSLFFNLVDVITFVGVAFVSNRENFRNLCCFLITFLAVHEGMFVVFLFASSLYMLTVLAIHRICKRDSLLSPRLAVAAFSKFKKQGEIEGWNESVREVGDTVARNPQSPPQEMLSLGNWALSPFLRMVSLEAPGLLAKTSQNWFSATEYGIAIANMGFHMTAAYDFQDLMLTTTLKKPYSG
ncbi:hypothetical protein X801_02146 [Opisthorchis viverrini]|uniref:CWH43-like N-terminal domain-containing protein n=1 Tax=Opisthorchis viverrini TaxID=6198 RepID=A0A1S8X5E6_OPIVI|nr:hypothetical protein X801_02146 [Opisthorchis viverrini]